MFSPLFAYSNVPKVRETYVQQILSFSQLDVDILDMDSLYCFYMYNIFYSVDLSIGMLIWYIWRTCIITTYPHDLLIDQSLCFYGNVLINIQ